MSVSLDGYIEGPNREIDWHLVDDELHRHFNDRLKGMGAFLSGRVTYELMASFWPTADSDPASTPPMVEFARIWRDMPKIVYSNEMAVDLVNRIPGAITFIDVSQMSNRLKVVRIDGRLPGEKGYPLH